MTRPPPRSTLFPYATLFRAVDPVARQDRPAARRGRRLLAGRVDHRRSGAGLEGPASRRPRGDVRQHLRGGEGGRSEEHTSELQSRQYLVCRLLLEKKKKPPEHRYPQRATRSWICCTSSALASPRRVQPSSRSSLACPGAGSTPAPPRRLSTSTAS